MFDNVERIKRLSNIPEPSRAQKQVTLESVEMNTVVRNALSMVERNTRRQRLNCMSN